MFFCESVGLQWLLLFESMVRVLYCLSGPFAFAKIVHIFRASPFVSDISVLQSPPTEKIPMSARFVHPLLQVSGWDPRLVVFRIYVFAS